MDYSRIKIELERKKISVRDLCNRIDVTEQGLHQMIRKKSMKIEVLERISSVLEVPASFWFENDASARNASSLSRPITEKQASSKLTREHIDSLTNNLNEMLKEIAFR